MPPASSVSNSGTGAVPVDLIDRDVLDRELALRVFGDTVIQHVAVANKSAPADWSNVVVAGQRRQHLLQRDEHRHRQGVRR